MHNVMQGNGTAQNAGLDAPYRMAGKSGTVQVISAGQRKNMMRHFWKKGSSTMHYLWLLRLLRIQKLRSQSLLRMDKVEVVSPLLSPEQ